MLLLDSPDWIELNEGLKRGILRGIFQEGDRLFFRNRNLMYLLRGDKKLIAATPAVDDCFGMPFYYEILIGNIDNPEDIRMKYRPCYSTIVCN